MATTREPQAKLRRRGRPRQKEAPTGLVRRNLLIDPKALEELRQYYGTKSDSETVRAAVDAALMVFEAEKLREWLASHGGGPDDVYRHTAGKPQLPVYLRPEDVPESEKVD